MSLHARKALGGFISIATTVAVSAALLSVGPAPATARETHAGEAGVPRPVHITATATPTSRGPNHFNSSVNVALPAGGTAQITSPTLDPSMTKAKVEVEAPLSDQPGFEFVATTLLQQPTPKSRFLTCLILVQDEFGKELLDSATDSSDLRDYEAQAGTLVLVRLVFCLRISSLIAQLQAEQPGRTGRLAGTACGQGPVALKEKVRKSGGTYHLTAKGPPSTKKKNAKVKIKCKVVGPTKTVMTITAKKRGATLRSVLGANLSLGLASPISATTGAEMKVTFKAP
jgi:hypothetical protein